MCSSNSSVFTEVLLPFGISYSFDVAAYGDPVRWMAIVRSLWVVKFLVFDGLLPLAPGRVGRFAASLRPPPASGRPAATLSARLRSDEDGRAEPPSALKYVRATRHPGDSDGEQR